VIDIDEQKQSYPESDYTLKCSWIPMLERYRLSVEAIDPRVGIVRNGFFDKDTISGEYHFLVQATMQYPFDISVFK
jgi:hypothetical protein